MSLGATLSLLGLYNYDPAILDSSNLILPAGVNRAILLPDLLAEAAAFELLYPEPSTLKLVLRSYSGHRVTVWERIAAAAALEYDPIENYDRREEWTDTGTGSSEQSGNSDITHREAGYNANNQGTEPDLVDQYQDTGTSGQTASTKGSSTHTGRTHGNIGVTTSQQMLEQEVAIAAKLDVYDYIIRDIIKRICIPLY